MGFRNAGWKRCRAGFKTLLGEGDSPNLLRGLRKFGTVPAGFETACSRIG